MKQQTTARRFSVFLIALTISMLALIGCGGNGSLAASSGTPASPSPSPTPSPTPAVPGSVTLTATPASLSFGSSALNTTLTQTVKIANTGRASATITQDSVIGAGFSTGLTTPLTLAAGQSVTATVVFTPTTAGVLSGSLSLSSNGSSLLSIPLSGAGVTPISHSVDVTWAASATAALQGYSVYRGTTSGGPYTRISPLLSSTTLLFTDAGVASGGHYFYVVTDMNASGVESATSNEVAVTVPVP